MGADASVPTVSLAGIILITVLLGTYLMCLSALALYSSAMPSWAQALDSFAITRIGAAMHKRLNLDVAIDTQKI